MMDQPKSPWAYKPWWCQPWSIVLTGISLIAGSWWGFHSLWVTLVVALPILLWMGFFLLIWPQLMMRLLLEEQAQTRPAPDPSKGNS